MARAFGVDHQLFVAGRDLLGGEGVTDLALSLAHGTYEETAFRSPVKRFANNRELGEVPLSLTAWLDPQDTPAGVVRGITERTIRGGATLRFWPGRGRPSLVAGDVNLSGRTYQFSKEAAVKLEASGRLNPAFVEGRSTGIRSALSLEDGTLTGDTGTATLGTRALDLRSHPYHRLGAFRFDGPGGRIFWNTATPGDDDRAHGAASRTFIGGDRVAFDDISGAGVINLVRLVSAVYSDTYRQTVLTAAPAGAEVNPWAAGQPSRAAYAAAGAAGDFRIVQHTIDAHGRPSHQAGAAQAHALVFHIPSVTWAGRTHLQIRPAYRDVTSAGARTPWDQTNAGLTIAAGDVPYFGWHWLPVDAQPADVALDWVFSGGAAGSSGFRVLADYVPIVPHA